MTDHLAAAASVPSFFSPHRKGLRTTCQKSKIRCTTFFVKYIFFILIALFWGGSFIAIKEVVTVAPPLMGATMRLAAALIFFFIFFPATGKKFFVPRPLLWKVWLTGLFIQGIPFSLLFWGEQRISPGLAGILNGCTPVFTFILSFLFLRGSETITSTKVIGLLISLVGMCTIFYPKLQMTGSHDELMGTISVFLMAVSYAVGTILARRNFSGKDKIDIYAGIFQQTLASFVYLTILSFLFEDWRHHLPEMFSTTVILGSLYLGWISTAIAFLLFYYLMEHWGAIRVSSVTYLVPLAALIFDYLFNHQVPTTYEFSGVIIILTGIALIQLSQFIRIFKKQ
jgi:drug/metabolite transporter (DMT)-like permease